MTTSNLLSTSQAAARLGIARQTVVQRIGTGRLTPTQKLDGPNGAYLFDADYIERIAADEKQD